MSARKLHLLGATLMGCMLLSPAAQANQQQATVILSQSCEYMLLNSSGGMVLVKQRVLLGVLEVAGRCKQLMSIYYLIH